MQQAFWYTLAVGSNEHGVEIAAAVQVSDHHHVVPTDQRAELGNFMRDFHRDLANFTKCHRGWPEEVFSSAQPSAVVLCSPEVIVQKIAYTIVQPVAAGAVKYSKDWPGAITSVNDLGRRVIRVKRPHKYFDPGNPRWPEYAELKLTIPKVLLDHYGSEDAVRAAVQAEVDRQEREARAEVERKGWSYLGARRATRVPFTRRARSREEFGALNPKFAAGGDPAVTKQAVAKMRAFYTAYRKALDAWKKGVRDVLFPFGTWWMRIHHRVACEPPPA